MPDILCVGSALWDIIGRTPVRLEPGSDVPGRIVRTPGGVALNIAATLARLGLRPALLSCLGADAEGQALLAELPSLGIDGRFIHLSEELPTDRYMAIEGPDGLMAAIADAHSLEAAGARILAPLVDGRLASPARPWVGPVAIDGNLTRELLAEIAGSPLLAQADLRVAPASPGKAERLLPFLSHTRATLYLNRHEAEVLTLSRFSTAAEAAAALVARGARRVIVTDGPAPAADATAKGGILSATPPAVPTRRITGAGDSFMAAHVAAELAGRDRPAALEAATRAAAAHIAGDIPG